MTKTAATQIQDLLQRRAFEEAEPLIKKMIEDDVSGPDGYYFQGISHYFQGQLGSAAENLKKALDHDPQHTDAAICLSVLYNDIGKYEEAKQVFERANQSVSLRSGATSDVSIDQKFAVKHLELADLYLRYRRYEEAIEEYGKASMLDPENTDIRIRRSRALAKKGFVTRALQELQQLKAEKPTCLPARLQLGLVHYSQGNLLDAELEWESIIELEPAHREALAYLEMARRTRQKTLDRKNRDANS